MRSDALLDISATTNALNEIHNYTISRTYLDRLIRVGRGPKHSRVGGRVVIRWGDATSWADKRPLAPPKRPPCMRVSGSLPVLTEQQILTDVLAAYLCQNHQPIWEEVCKIPGQARRDKLNALAIHVIEQIILFLSDVPTVNPVGK